MMTELSQRQFDMVCGLTIGHTNSIETGARTNLESDTLLRICDATGMTLDYFVRGVGARPSSKTVKTRIDNARFLQQASTGTDDD
jgi:transcriptional regulator with XRE-family HTH domain